MMLKAMKIRTKLNGEVAEIRITAAHPMETGQRKETNGKIVPAHFMQSLTVAVDEKILIDGQTGAYLSRNPTFSFKVKGVKAGQKIIVTWSDSKGESRSDEVVLAEG
jgi:sulfur-oxidizing protein SoxZ